MVRLEQCAQLATRRLSRPASRAEVDKLSCRCQVECSHSVFQRPRPPTWPLAQRVPLQHQPTCSSASSLLRAPTGHSARYSIITLIYSPSTTLRAIQTNNPPHLHNSANIIWWPITVGKVIIVIILVSMNLATIHPLWAPRYVPLRAPAPPPPTTLVGRQFAPPRQP